MNVADIKFLKIRNLSVSKRLETYSTPKNRNQIIKATISVILFTRCVLILLKD